jgi:Uncharacterized protein conserved in bacteria (DUF2191).
MRTTVRLDDDLLATAKQHAARTGRTLTALLEDALRTLLALESKRRPGSAKKLPTFRGGGLRPGVDLDDSAALLDVMENSDAAR